MRSVILACVSTIVLVGCSCENNTPPPAAELTPPVDAAQPGIAVGEPNPATPPPADPNAPPVDGEVTLKAAATSVAGANVVIAWTGPGNSGDYIDIVPRGYADTKGEITYDYVRNSNGAATVRAPTEAGEYDIRYVLDMAGPRTVKATSPLTVTAAAATLTGPATAETGQDLEFGWTGPNGPGDYIDLVKAGVTATSGEITYAYTSAGSPAKLEAPSSPGAYQIRYVLEGPNGRKVPTGVPLTVTQARATLKAPGSVAKGAKFKVDWTGPKSSGDYIDLVPKGATATSGEKSYFYVTGAPDLTAPTEAGDYEVRYVLEAPGGRAILARVPVQVR